MYGCDTIIQFFFNVYTIIHLQPQSNKFDFHEKIRKKKLMQKNVVMTKREERKGNARQGKKGFVLTERRVKGSCAATATTVEQIKRKRSSL